VRWLRRAWTFPLYGVLAAVTVGLYPLLLAAALAVDLVRRDRLALARLATFAAVYLLAELAGLAASFALWLAGGTWCGADRERFLAWNFRLQRLWARSLLAATQRVFALRLVVEGGGEAARGPLLVFPRHTSLADVLLPAVLLGDRQRLRLRWVLKRELLADPCLDVVGSRLPNVFVDRSALRSEREIAAVTRLGEGLGPRDGVLIYPEGTRFTPERLRRAIARLEPARRGRLEGLRHLLPPRAGGATALLAAAPDADVLVLGHVGLEGLSHVRDLLSGALVGRSVRVRSWRHAAASVPREREAALAWLDARWRELDAWVDARLRGAPPPGDRDSLAARAGGTAWPG
jgi:1-acyl-sn-glycerol-3-phosphate acyltransferase